MVGEPQLDVAQRVVVGELRSQLGGELRLAAGPLEEEHEPPGDGERRVAAQVVLDEAAATTDAGVTKAQWPAGVTGRPKAFGALGDPPPAESGDLPEGFYLWSGFDGWHVWLVGGGEGDRVTITSDDAISKAEPTGGPADVQVFGNTFALQRGSATERVVGADFNPGYYAKNMIITLDGELEQLLDPPDRLDHLADGVTQGRADAVLAASIFHFGDHTVREAKELMRARGIEVRL